MDLKYLNYSIEELVDDEAFRAWVLYGKHDGEWDALIEKKSFFAEKAHKAREMILLLQESSDALNEEEAGKMWQKIARFEHQYHKKGRVVMVRKVFYLAASVLLLLSLGVTGYFYYQKNKKGEYRFFSSRMDLHDNQYARLILSDGEKIDIKSKKRENNLRIMLDKNSGLTINDSVIDLSGKEGYSGEKVRMNEVIIPYGKRSEFILPDNSRVIINSGTRFAFPAKFTGKKREVFLEGEACFEVAEDKNTPFIVNTGKIKVTVLGTHFNVSAYATDQNIETILLKGKVSVYENTNLGWKKHGVILNPNQKASFNKKNNTMTVTEVPDAGRYISWTKGWLQFSDKSIQYVLKKVELYYNVQVVYDKNFHSTNLISGKLDINESLDDVMKILADVAKVNYRIQDHIVYIE